VPDPAHEASLRGVSLVGLRANGAFRWARAVFRGEPAVARLEIALAASAGAGELAHALGALCVAARASVREARAVAGEPSVAAALLGRSSFARSPSLSAGVPTRARAS
jgi:hypothetical protein